MEEEVKTQKSYGSAFDLLGKSYERVKANWQPFAFVYILSLIGGIFSTFNIKSDEVDNSTNTTSYATGAYSGIDPYLLGGLGVFSLLIVIVAFYLLFAQVILHLRTAQDKKPSIGEIVNETNKKFFKLLGLSILISIIVIIGFILFFIPGIFAIGRLAMAPYLLIDRNLGVIEAIKQSNKFATGRMMPVYAALGVLVLVAIFSGIVSAIPVIGPLPSVLITIAFSVVLALRYQQMKKATV